MSENTPQLRDLRPKLHALLPQNMQARVLAGVALLMTLVIVFSGRKPTPPNKPVIPSPAAQASDPNLARIQEYRTGIEAATRQLAAQEEELTEAKQSFAQANRSGFAPRANAVLPMSGQREYMSHSFAESDVTSAIPESQKREERSPFASNIALSYRQAAVIPEKSAQVLANESEPIPAKDEAPTDPKLPYRLREGTVIETVLTNRLDSSFAGPVDCMVTTNVYSADRTVVLIPQGSRVLGEVRKIESLGEQRLAVVFHRLIRPDDYSINLDKFQGLSQVGETGLLDQVNHHYLQIFGAAIAIGAVAGLAQANTTYGANESAADVYRQGVSSSLSQSSIHILDRYLNVLPTFTIREGHRVKVYLSQDLSLLAYRPVVQPEVAP